MICMAELDREALVTDNLGLVYHWAGKLVARDGRVAAMGLDEAQGVGFLSLVKASRKFKPELGFTFGTYASTCICRSIRKASRQWQHIGCPDQELLEARPDDNREDENFWSLVYRDCSPVERRIVKQHYQQGLTIREIAVQSPGGKSHQAARLAHRNALKKAKARLESHPEYGNKLIDPGQNG